MIRAAWRRLKGYRLLILAGALTAAEGAASLGVPLPFSDHIPATWRGLVIAGIGGAAFVLRTLAARRERRQ